MAIPLIVAGAGLTIALLDRLSAFNETAEKTAEKATLQTEITEIGKMITQIKKV